jgi:D-alanyl-D-alanine carboxypeptidase (penicillin-binding protein 5/6)
MAAPTRDIRNAAAVSLLDWGFANYGFYKGEVKVLEPIKVKGGTSPECKISYPEFTYVTDKKDISRISAAVEIPENISAPIKRGECVGRVVYKIGETEVGSVDIVAEEDVDRIGFWRIMLKLLSKMAMC